MTVEEVRAEQLRVSKQLEESRTLKTREAREADQNRKKRKYRFGLIRIRLPGALLLQGTFGAQETVGALYEFVQSCLHDEESLFELRLHPSRQVLDNPEQSLESAGLLPSSIVNFSSLVEGAAVLKPVLLSSQQTL
eukprot:m.98380 g.98380  ORF g.98380 m.98380 type:complete len:136 (+) comp18565_c0_seq2:140-547(+)